MHVGVKALKWMSVWTPRLRSHESPLRLTELYYTLTKSSMDPCFPSAVLYNTVPSWRYGTSVSF